MAAVAGRKKRVCVVGAGPAGLVSAKELKSAGFSVQVFEQGPEVGGQWRYTPCDGEVPPHSSVYASLRVLNPRESLALAAEFPFERRDGCDMRRYPGHREVLRYLQEFCDHFGLRELVKFDTRVEYVGFEEGTDGLRWFVRHKNGEKYAEEDVFDAVVIANGHNTVPRLPAIRGMGAWKGRQMHSHVYRTPDPFRDEVVVVVGAAASGHDISLEVAKVAKEVHISAKTLEVPEGMRKMVSKYDNMHLHPQIDELCENSIVKFVDGWCIDAGTIIYCTGYKYSFPFLDTKGAVTVDDNRVGPLFQHTFPPSLAPSLAFVGITSQRVSFPFLQAQARWISLTLSGKYKLPTAKEMLKATENFINSRDASGLPKHRTHDITEFEFWDSYGDMFGFPRLEPWIRELWIDSDEGYFHDFENYRDCQEYDNDSVVGTSVPPLRKIPAENGAP